MPSENMNTVPKWVDGKKIDEVRFCSEFLKEHPMVSVNGAFFTVDGLVSDENLLKKEIYDSIKQYITTGLPKKVSNLLEVLRMECCTEGLPLYQDRIHVVNGTLLLDGSFSEEKDFSRNRLPVAYCPDALLPAAWLEFLSQLLYAEDILTLQEFFGYFLIPSTRGQKMLLLTGKGGEGKSRVGIVLQALLGSNMKTGSIAKVENSPFARADLQNMLVMVDDDMKMEALTQTNNIKAIVTAELPMDLEKKGQQSYQADLRVRFLAFGNGTLQALHDRSFGFFRRQIILEARERDPSRRDDPYLADKLCSEKEGIFLWALEGLQRLIRNNFQFTLSQRANRKNLTKWQDDFWKFMVKKYPDLERGESASETGRTHIPPRLFKEATHLNQQRDALMALLGDINPLNAKKRAAEIEALLDKYIPGVEKMRTRLKKYNSAYKELKTEVAALEKEVDASKESVLKRMETTQKLRELEELQKVVASIPEEILRACNDRQNKEKETISIE